MSWNYRVVRYPLMDDVEPVFGIHEAYYQENGIAITEQAVGISFESIEEFNTTIERMKEAFNKPILDYETRQEIGEWHN